MAVFDRLRPNGFAIGPVPSGNGCDAAPPMLLGLPGDATYANYREANRALWRLTVLPMAERILRGIGKGLAAWRPDLKFAIDVDQVTALAEDRERLWRQVRAADFLTQEEKREMLGFQPNLGPQAPAD